MLEFRLYIRFNCNSVSKYSRVIDISWVLIGYGKEGENNVGKKYVRRKFGNENKWVERKGIMIRECYIWNWVFFEV